MDNITVTVPVEDYLNMATQVSKLLLKIEAQDKYIKALMEEKNEGLSDAEEVLKEISNSPGSV